MRKASRKFSCAEPCLGLLLLALGVASARSSTTNAPSLDAASPSILESSAAINPVLARSHEIIASSNLVFSTQGGSHPDSTVLAAQLELAREQRKAHNYALATQTLVGLLERADLPEDMTRSCLLELALSAQADEQLTRAQQIYAQYLRKWPEDPDVPEILLRQGLLYRQMGASTLALSKFYAVMTSALNLKSNQLKYYQRLVLQAQTEIADTYYTEGKYHEAAEYFSRLLRLEDPDLNKASINMKLVRCLSRLDESTEVVVQGKKFLDRYPNARDEPEVRFLLAQAYQKLERTSETLQQVKELLDSPQAAANPEVWTYWQQRTGNQIGNQLYKQGDYLGALDVYLSLAKLSPGLEWQLPVLYQIGLIYEKLLQSPKAIASYEKIVSFENQLTAKPSPPNLRMILDMAKWRVRCLKWEANAEAANHQLSETSPSGSTVSGAQ